MKLQIKILIHAVVCVYTTSQKFLNSKIFYVFFLILFCSPTLHLFYPKYSKSSNIVKYFYYSKWLLSIWIYFKM